MNGSILHGKLSEIDSVLATPDLEMFQILDGRFLWWQHENYIFFVILSDNHGNMRISPEIRNGYDFIPSVYYFLTYF